MRKILSVLLLAAALLTAAGCGKQTAADAPPSNQESQTTQETQTPIASQETDLAVQPEAGEPVIDGDMAVYTLGGIQIPLPVEYLDALTVTVGEDFDPSAGLPDHWHSLLSVQERASVEALMADFGTSEGGGFLFGIVVMDQAGFEQYIQYETAGCDIFARNDTYYYAKTYPTDVQFYRSEGIVGLEANGWADWETLNALGDEVCAGIIQRNGLTPYTIQEVWAQPFTYESGHAYAKYYHYYTFDGSTAEFYTLVLSQPARQGEGGLWCVERIIDVYGNTNLWFPESGLPAAEYYAQLQAECDAGQHPELLTPLGAAKAFVEDSMWFSDTATDENVVLMETGDSGGPLYEAYADVSRLAAADITPEDHAVFDDRALLLEDSLDNEAEQLVYEYYYSISSAKFEGLMDLIGENEALQIAAKNEEANFLKGLYRSEYVILDLTTLTADDLRNISEFGKEDILGKLDTFGFTQYAVVQAAVRWTHNQASLEAGSQTGNGMGLRYFLLAATADVPEFKLYEVYWDDFLTA